MSASMPSDAGSAFARYASNGLAAASVSAMPATCSPTLPEANALSTAASSASPVRPAALYSSTSWARRRSVA